MCVFTGCDDMSAVFDKNNNKVSDQLYDMTFGSDNNLTGIYTMAYCHNNSLDASSYTALSTNNNFVVNNNDIATCGDNIAVVLDDTTNEHRHYICTLDTTNINSGKSYWKTKTASCDLNAIKNTTGYTAYLKTGSSIVSLNNKSTQYRYFNSIYWKWLYTDQTSNFTLTCNSNGNWEMTKTNNSCQGLPAMTIGSVFWENDNNILYVDDQPGMLMNTTTLSKDISILTTTMLYNTSQYFVTNGTKIEASCASGYQEIDKNNIILDGNNSNIDKGGHYYECVNGTWTARGGCAIKVDYYSPRLYDDANKNGTISVSKYVKIGDSITCNSETFNISDPDNGTLKICAIGGYRVASDGQTFTVSVPTNHTFCHKSYIPRDLGVGLNGSVGVDGWCDDWITNDTYKGVGANVSNGSSFSIEHTYSNVSASGTLICNNGTWKVGSGSMTFEYTGTIDTFCAPYGLKDAGKSITFELWGAQGGGSYGGKGGYTKGVMNSGNYINGTTYYVAVGQYSQKGSLTNAFNGGGRCGDRDGTTYHSGGGATHVAANDGVLSSLENNKTAVLLVAGGGGGNGANFDLNKYCGSGSGGGGNNNGDDGSSGNGGKGGTQEAGGDGIGGEASGSFGKGADCSEGHYCFGGGGGYYGGGASSMTGGAGGGSGYCNTSKFTCSGSNGQRSGNGYVKISW